MLNQTEISAGIAKILKDLRLRHGLSKAKMADELFINPHTWTSWETGVTAPTVPEFMQVFDAFNEDALRPVLDLVYPDIFSHVTPQSAGADFKTALLYYISNVASERIVRNMAFLIFGKHGSNIEPQLQMFVAVDHLPLVYRVIICEQVLAIYKLAEYKGDLIHTDKIMPDIKLIEDALDKAKSAVKKNHNSYTTGVK